MKRQDANENKRQSGGGDHIISAGWPDSIGSVSGQQTTYQE